MCNILRRRYQIMGRPTVYSPMIFTNARLRRQASLDIAGVASHFQCGSALTVQGSGFNFQNSVRFDERRFPEICDTPSSAGIFEIEREVVNRHGPFAVRRSIAIYGLHQDHGFSEIRTEGLDKRSDQSIAPCVSTWRGVAGGSQGAPSSEYDPDDNNQRQGSHNWKAQFTGPVFHRFGSHCNTRSQIRPHSHHRTRGVETRSTSRTRPTNARSDFPTLVGCAHQ